MLDNETRRFRHFVHDENNSASLSHNNVLSLLEDVKGRLWVGTRNGLNLLDRSTNTFQVFRNEDGLPDHNIISLQDDGEGNLWIATLNGLSNLRVNEETGRFDFRNYDLLDGLQGMEFNEHSSFKTSKGELDFWRRKWVQYVPSGRYQGARRALSGCTNQFQAAKQDQLVLGRKLTDVCCLTRLSTSLLEFR
jgi:hypothetical protein